MTKQQSIETIEIALNYFEWKGGTVRQIAEELYKRTGVERTTTLHVYIRDRLIELGAIK